MLFRDLRSAGALMLLTLGLAACAGGSSTSPKAAGKPATASAAASTTTRAPSGGSTHASSSHSSTLRSTTGPPAHSTTAAQPSHASTAAASAQLKQAQSSFTACLSRNGVKLPPANGGQTATALSLKGIDTKSPSFRRALTACIHVINTALKATTKTQPGPASSTGGGSASASAPGIGSVKIPASVTAGYKRFTACMRSNGAPGFPEPTGMNFNLAGTHLNPHSPQYKTAETRCNPILQAVDTGG